MYIYIHTYTYIHTFKHTYIHAYIYVYYAYGVYSSVIIGVSQYSAVCGLVCRYYSKVPHFIGKLTLETYLMQVAYSSHVCMVWFICI